MSKLGSPDDVTSAFIDECVTALRNNLNELLTKALYDPIKLLVIGCSTSEVAGNSIGSKAYPGLGKALAEVVLSLCNANGIALAAQCCEHLNRALVVERSTLDAFQLQRVIAVPTPEAGGSFASAVFKLMKAPVLVESVEADAGMDIGSTLIGMHLKRVAVPIRLDIDCIGKARCVAAVTRPPYTGGPRASY
ncbi:UPF0340 protein YwlG [Clostridia bacterium]|nr:UPF0340 protein YwlG [Clostridia bacterium]